MFIASMFTIAKKVARNQVATNDEWIKKIWHTHKSIILSEKAIK